jgi:hypothetical protein
MKIRVLILALFAVPCFAQAQWSPGYIMETISTPWVAPSGTDGLYTPNPSNLCTGTTNNGTGGMTRYCAEMTNEAPWIDGFNMSIRWPVGYNTDGGVDTGFEIVTIPTSNPPPAAQYNFTNLNKTVFAPLASFPCATKLGRSHPCWFSLKMAPSQSAINIGQVPDYVYQYGAGAWPDMVCPTWQSGTTYYAQQCAKYSGSFYQSADALSHVATGNSGPLSDGGSWSGPLTHAPPLDVSTSASFSGAYTANTLPCSSGNSATCPANSNINSTNCGTGTQACTTAMLERGFEADWENPLWVAMANAVNALNQDIAGQSFASSHKYMRPGIFTDGTSFNQAEPAMQLLTGNSQSNLETVISAWYAIYLSQLITNVHASGALLDCVFAGNTTTEDSQLQTSCSQNADMMGAQGMQNNDYLNWYVGNRTTNGWTAAFQTFNMKAFHTQPIAESDTTHCTPLVSDPGQSCTLIIVPLIMMVRNNKPIYYEVYQGEIDCAVDTNNPAGCNGTGPNFAWQTALVSLAKGVPFPLKYGLAGGRR